MFGVAIGLGLLIGAGALIGCDLGGVEEAAGFEGCPSAGVVVSLAIALGCALVFFEGFDSHPKSNAIVSRFAK